MRLTSDDYLAQQQQLLPAGDAWPRDKDATLTKLLRAFADGWAAIHQRVLDLLRERDPRTAAELLADWETECGLPDPCTGQSESTDERRARVHARLTARGGQSRGYFKRLAQALGYDVTIEEFRVLTCEDPSDGGLNPFPWPRAWVVHAGAQLVRELACDGTCAEPLRTWGDQALECTIRRYAPAHTTVHFAYGD